MGLGKTVQAIAAAAYSTEWPLLVGARRRRAGTGATSCCGGCRRCSTATAPSASSPPPSARAPTRWPPGSAGRRISYDLARGWRRSKAARFGVVICDESQAIKSRTAQRTKAATVLHAARRALLLSGTWALSRPAELFTQLNAIDKETYRTWTAFAMRYCDARRTQYGLDVSGASNLPSCTPSCATAALRRLKADVIGELPPKDARFCS